MQFLPSDWKDAARKLGAMRRQRKFTNPADLLRVLLIHIANGCSMRETAARAKQGGLIRVSDVALLKRLQNSSEWFRWMAMELVSRRGVSMKPPDEFSNYNIKSVDASVVTEPGSTGTDWRLHYSIDLFGLRCDQFLVSRPDIGESFVNFKVEDGDLFIGDRAYGRLRGFRHVIAHGGHFLARLKNKAFKIHDLEGRELNLLKELKTLEIGRVKEMRVATSPGAKAKMTPRLLAIRKSDEEADKAMEKAVKDQKRKQRRIDPETIEFHRYICLVSSLPDSIANHRIADLYRTRWQIEIAFKRLKSIMALGHLPKKDEASARAWLHGKLFVALLTQAIVDEGRFFSPWGYPMQTTMP